MNKEEKQFHASRRKEFSRLIGKDSIAIIFGSTHKNKSYDADFPFKQFKNFHYLTGFIEANSALMIAPAGINLPPGKKGNNIFEALYVMKKDPLMETWNGKRLGFEKVKPELGIDIGFENELLRLILFPKFLNKFRKLYINFGEMINLTGEMKKILTFFMESLNIVASNTEVIDVSYLLGKMRAVKTEFEIKQIKRACEISIKSYDETLKIIKPGLNESQVQANLEFNYKNNGSKENAYPPIVAGGENACVLHYDSNDQVLKNGDLLLIDSGAEYNYYCSDITRTFPVNGKFTKLQKLIYEIVLKANEECIKKIKPGIKFSEIHKLSDDVLAKGLNNAGVLKDKMDIKKYSVHGVGHHLGLDTHDAVSSSRKLKEDNDTLVPGNVLTIEPGLYFPAGSKGIPKEFWNTGVRIEDDILVTNNGGENLTRGMIKEAGEIETAMRN